MKIKELKLYQFRNYSELNIRFEDGLNYIEGANGAGKTSLVEAIGLLPLSKSIRCSDEKEAIQINEEYAVVQAIVQKRQEEKIKIVVSKNAKHLEVNDTKVSKLSDLAGIVKVISFLPKDVEFFKDTPTKRRRFLDSNMSMLDKRYLKTLSEYQHYLEEIRTLLKEESVDKIYLSVLLKEISKRGYVIEKRRKKFVTLLNQEIQKVGKYLEGKEISFQLKYLPNIDVEDETQYLNELQRRTIQTLEQKKRIIQGIHLDDLSMIRQDKDIALYGSQGQNRMAVIILKLGLFKLVKEKFDEEPIVILDDVLSELDQVHQQKLIHLLKRMEQVFITGTQFNEVEGTLYIVEGNKVRRNK